MLIVNCDVALLLSTGRIVANIKPCEGSEELIRSSELLWRITLTKITFS